MHDYHLNIHYEIENNFIVKEISFAKDRIKQLHEMRKILIQRFEKIDVQ